MLELFVLKSFIELFYCCLSVRGYDVIILIVSAKMNSLLSVAREVHGGAGLKE